MDFDSQKQQRLVLILLVLALVFYQWLATPAERHFIGYQTLLPDATSDCYSGLLHPNLKYQAKTFGTFTGKKVKRNLLCKSTPLLVLSKNIEVSYAGSPGLSVRAQVVTENSPEPISLNLPGVQPGQNANDWRKELIHLPDVERDQIIRLKIFDQDYKNKDSWLIVRSRVDFFADKSWFESFRDQLAIPEVRMGASVVIAFLVTFLVFGSFFKSAGNISFLVFIFALTFFVHFRLENFFMWDEWHLIQRFYDQGIKGVFFSHNGHFMPVYFLFYYLVSKVSGDFYPLYLAVVCALHALNCFLLYKFLVSLIRDQESDTQWGAKILTVVYCVSALHLEILQGAASYCFLLNQLFTFIGISAVLKYYRENSSISFWLAIAMLILAPLTFGNGLMLLPQLLLFGFIAYLERNSNRAEISKRAFRIFKYGFFVSVIIVGLYIGFQGRKNESPSLGNLVGHFSEVSSYLAVGSQFGTIFRGLGFYSDTNIVAAYDHLPERIQQFVVYRHVAPEMVYAILGTALSFLILFLSVAMTSNKRQTFQFWLVSQLTIFLLFLLPTISRWDIGAFQSLSLRYQYSPLVYLMMMIFPLTLWTLRYRLTRAILGIWIFVFVSSQVYWLLKDDQYTQLGIRHRAFADQLMDWGKVLERKGENVHFQGIGYDIHGLYPIGSWTMTPNRTSEDIYNILKKLNPSKYDLVAIEKKTVENTSQK